jgi:hypothetical protein
MATNITMWIILFIGLQILTILSMLGVGWCLLFQSKQDDRGDQHG